MSTSTPSGASLGKRAVAVLVLLLAAYILFKIFVGFLMAVLGAVLVVVVVAALIWAIRVLQGAFRVAGGAYISIALGFAVGGGVVGRIKGSSFWLWFLISGAIPVLGLLAAVCYRSERDELRRQCPTCGRICKLHDALCVRCGTELEFPEQALASETAAPSLR